MANHSLRLQPVTERQLHILVNYMEDHKELFRGRITSSFTREKKNAMWEELADNLNDLTNGCPKSVAKWQRTWIEWKSAVKRKARNREKGRPSNKQLTPLEKRAFQLMHRMENGTRKNESDLDDQDEMSQYEQGVEKKVETMNLRIDDVRSIATNDNSIAEVMDAVSTGIRNESYAGIEDIISVAVKNAISAELKKVICTAIKTEISSRMQSTTYPDIMTDCCESKAAYTGMKYVSNHDALKENKATSVGIKCSNLPAFMKSIASTAFAETNFIPMKGAISSVTCSGFKQSSSVQEKDATSIRPTNVDSLVSKDIAVDRLNGDISNEVTDDCTSALEETIFGVKHQPSTASIYTVSPANHNFILPGKNPTSVELNNTVFPGLKEVTPVIINDAGPFGINYNTFPGAKATDSSTLIKAPLAVKDGLIDGIIYVISSGEKNATLLDGNIVSSTVKNKDSVGIKDGIAGVKDSSYETKEVTYVAVNETNTTAIKDAYFELKDACNSELKEATFVIKEEPSLVTTYDITAKGNNANLVEKDLNSVRKKDTVSLGIKNVSYASIQEYNSVGIENTTSCGTKDTASVGVKTATSVSKRRPILAKEAPAEGTKYSSAGRINLTSTGIKDAVSAEKKTIPLRKGRKRSLKVSKNTFKKENIWTVLQKRHAALTRCLGTSKKQGLDTNMLLVKPSSSVPKVQGVDIVAPIAKVLSNPPMGEEVNINESISKSLLVSEVEEMDLNTTVATSVSGALKTLRADINEAVTKCSSINSEMQKMKMKKNSETKRKCHEQHNQEKQGKSNEASEVKSKKPTTRGDDENLLCILQNSILERLDTLNRNVETNTCALTILSKAIQDSAETNMRAVNNLSKVISNFGSALFSSSERLLNMDSE